MQSLKRLLSCGRNLNKIYYPQKRLKSSLYEPDYLEEMKSKIPLYDTVNIQLRGYDFSILENYQKFLHNLIANMNVNVEECWAVPAQSLSISTFKPKSNLVNSQYSLKIYERMVQITDVTSLQMPILLRLLEASTPAGVTVQVMPHEDWHEDVRYVPDKELITLKQELEDISTHKKK